MTVPKQYQQNVLHVAHTIFLWQGRSRQLCGYLIAFTGQLCFMMLLTTVGAVRNARREYPMMSSKGPKDTYSQHNHRMDSNGHCGTATTKLLWESIHPGGWYVIAGLATLNQCP